MCTIEFYFLLVPRILVYMTMDKYIYTQKVCSTCKQDFSHQLHRREKEVGVKGYQFSNLHYGSPKKCTARQTKYIHSIKAVNKLCRGIRFYTKMHLFSHCGVVSIIYHGPMLALPHLFLDIFAP